MEQAMTGDPAIRTATANGAGDGEWRRVASWLRARMADGTFAPADRLPTHTDLARILDASRHAVRRALARLAEEGLVRSWQGRGVFVESPRCVYRLGHRVRFRENLPGTCTVVLRSATRLPPARIGAALGLSRRDHVLMIELLRHVAGRPVALTRHWLDAARLPRLLDHLDALCDLPAALQAHGVGDIRRAETLIEARLPSRHEAAALAIAPTQPVLVSTACNTDLAGRGVELSEAIWRADAVQLVA
jgi:GntR family transcriptional regulator, phosphonate transport system regulatory protein